MFLGINAYSHDASAAIISEDGEVVAAVEEERFTRKKKESRFPAEAIRACLRIASVQSKDILGIGYAWHPFLLIRDRVIRSNLFTYPVPAALIMRNIRKAVAAASVRSTFEREVGELSSMCKVHFFRHHAAHVSSAYFASSFLDAAFLSLDGRGECESGTFGVVMAGEFEQKGRIIHPNSLGNLYTGFARFCGFESTDKDGVAMAFAATGEPIFRQAISKILGIDRAIAKLRFTMPRRLLDCRSGDAMPTPALDEFLGIKRRVPGGPILPGHRDVSASVQAVLEEIILDTCQRLQAETKMSELVMAGGVFLNSVANGRLRKESGFRSFFIQPAAHDAGLALGCCYSLVNHLRRSQPVRQRFSPLLGPQFSRAEILTSLEASNGLVWREPVDIADAAGEAISRGFVVGWFQGRMEFGPRALGNRSLLADPRSLLIKDRLNGIKGRESFRPFAVAILLENACEWLVGGTESPYMLLVDRFQPSKASFVPSGKHVDGSVRIQTVSEEDNPLFRKVILSFKKYTGVPLIINTSLNIRGEPLACTPSDALAVLRSSEIDALGIGPFWVVKTSSTLSWSPDSV